MAIYLGIAILVIVAAGGHDQELVLFYAVAVFISFLSGLLAMARFNLLDARRVHRLINLAGAGIVIFTIGVNLVRGYPLASLVASVAIGGVFYRLWVRQGRPRGIAQVETVAERELGDEA